MTTLQHWSPSAGHLSVDRSFSTLRWSMVERVLTVALTVVCVAILAADHVRLALAVSLLGAVAARVQSRVSRQTKELNLGLEEASALVQIDQARLHEVKATLAGITSASTLMREHPDLDLARRDRLEGLVDAELARLGRLLDGPRGGSEVAVDLDQLINHFALIHRTKQHQVDWERTGAMIRGKVDEVAEVLHILLDNASKHGRGAARVEVASADGFVEVRVSDDGPGVDPALEAQIFEWGVRGPRSAGSGLGLAIASRTVRTMGGELRIDTSADGTAFLARMPAADARVAG